ncbi:MAG: hypothetical protein M3131_08135, partial [Actinomycetota bacterium]|nr:hypothetical protein [Actinomycetota bacterium]
MRWHATVHAQGEQMVHRRGYHPALGALACGLACAAAPIDVLALVAAMALALVCSLGAERRGLLCASLFLAGGIAGGERLEAIDAPARSLASESRITARAHLLERPRPARFGSRAEVHLT